jgi:hypothetical protein
MRYVKNDYPGLRKSRNQPVIDFWNHHLPIAVRNDYQYFALNVSIGDNFGSIVSGYEPEFEEPETVASSFQEFLERIMTNSIEF